MEHSLMNQLSMNPLPLHTFIKQRKDILKWISIMRGILYGTMSVFQCSPIITPYFHSMTSNNQGKEFEF